mgnify:CR=1 FL=1
MKMITLLKIFSFPILIYIVFFSIRFSGYQVAIEGELGDFITALIFLTGAVVAYFVFIYMLVNVERNNKEMFWWYGMSFLLVFIAFDELFMIHETIGYKFNINDTVVLLSYGIFLGLLLLINLRATLQRTTFIFLSLFAVFAVISQGADYLYNEGIVQIAGREVSYEQLLESFGALFLAAAVINILSNGA